MSRKSAKIPPHLKLKPAKSTKMHSDIARLKKKTNAQDVKSDRDAAPVTTRWPKNIEVHSAPNKVHISLRVDDETLRFFKKQGPGHLTRMNAVLRAYMEAHR